MLPYFRFFMWISVIGFLPASVEANQTVERLAQAVIVRDQGQTNTCWLHSSLQMMEQLAKTPLSVDALLIPEIYSRALDRYLGYETPWDGGAGPTRPWALALEFGLVPEAVWRPQRPMVSVYYEIFEDIEEILKRYPNFELNQSNYNQRFLFLEEVESSVKKHLGSLPPDRFEWNHEEISAMNFARRVIGPAVSKGYDFRPIPYSDVIYGRMPELPWATIISAEAELRFITEIIPKETDAVTALEAFETAARVFSEGRPVAFTFVTNNAEGDSVWGVDRRTMQYVAKRPAIEDAYTGSHLVLLTGLIRNEHGELTGFEVLDPITFNERDNGRRVVTRNFFETHGKTIHTIEHCRRVLEP